METQELKTIESTEQELTPMALLQIATKKGADVDKLQQLMIMKREYDADIAKKAYVAAMAKFRSECPTINKTSKVEFGTTKYTHATLAGALEQIKDLLGKNGLSHSWVTNQSSNAITVICRVTHELGHSEETSLIGASDTSGGKNAIQGIGSAVTYLQRYTLFSILGLAAAVDDDGASSEFINEEQIETLRKLVQESKADLTLFLKFLKAESLADILMTNYGKAESLLKAKIKIAGEK